MNTSAIISRTIFIFEDFPPYTLLQSILNESIKAYTLVKLLACASIIPAETNELIILLFEKIGAFIYGAVAMPSFKADYFKADNTNCLFFLTL